MDRMIILQEMMEKIAGINVLFNAAIDADADWQKKFIKENWGDFRQSLINDILDLMADENNIKVK